MTDLPKALPLLINHQWSPITSSLSLVCKAPLGSQTVFLALAPLLVLLYKTIFSQHRRTCLDMLCVFPTVHLSVISCSWPGKPLPSSLPGSTHPSKLMTNVTSFVKTSPIPTPGSVLSLLGYLT